MHTLFTILLFPALVLLMIVITLIKPYARRQVEKQKQKNKPLKKRPDYSAWDKKEYRR